MRDKLNLQLLILLLVFSIILLTISARGCPKRSRNRVGSSSPEWSLPGPSGLIATAVSSSEIQLTWQDNSNNEDGFQIERSTSPATGYSLLATVGSNTSSYPDNTVLPAQTYYYRVRALNTIGDRSEWSNIASATTPSILDQLVWAQVAAGSNHTLALTTNGTVWSWGNNDFGQLGLGDTTYTNRRTPSLIEFDINWGVFENISALSAGVDYSIALKTDGTLWSWGANGSGQLGMGDSFSSIWPAPITGTTGAGFDSDWSSVSAGGYHIIALKRNNTLWVWGWNESGQLGLGDTINRGTPSQIGTESDWSMVAGGYVHTIALKTNSTLWAWGFNQYGQLGDGTNFNTRTTPRQIGTESDWSSVAAGAYHTIGIKSNNTLWAWGDNEVGQLGDGTTDNRTTPRQIGIESDWSSVAGGVFHTIALKSNNTLWAWGYNQYGQLGLGFGEGMRNTPSQVTTENNWVSLATGANHTIALKSNNTLWAWGWNAYGQLGLGDGFDRNIPCLLRSPAPPSPLIATALGLSQIAITWTDNSNDETGFIIERGITNTNYSPLTTLGANTTSYLDTGLDPSNTYYYRVYAYNNFGNSPYATVSTNFNQIAPSFLIATTLGLSQIALTWTDNANDEAGFIIERGITNTAYSPIATVGANPAGGGTYYLDTGLNNPVPANTYYYRVYAYNNFGNSPYATGMTVFWQFAPSSLTATPLGLSQIALTWTDNANDETGFIIERGITNTDYSPIATVGANPAGGGTSYLDPPAGEAGTGLDPSNTYYYRVYAYNFGMSSYSTVSTNFNRIAPSSLIAQPLDLSQIAITWTDNSNDETGFRIERKLNAGGFYQEIATVDSGVISWLDTSVFSGTTYYYQVRAWNAFGNSPYSNEAWATLSGNWFKVTAASHHTIAMKSNGTIWSWGWNNKGQLGLGYTSISVTNPTQIIIGTDSDWSMVAAGGDNSVGGHSIGIKTNGTLWGWGYNSYGQLGIGDSGAGKDRTTPTQIDINSDWIAATCGTYHTIALKTDRTIWSWGWNNRGQLGLADTTNRSTPSYIGTDSDWSMVTAGGSHTIGRKTNGAIWAWGYNENGQLGLGDVNRNTPSQISSALDWSMVTAGSEYTVALKTDLTIWAWGRNNYGQLGLGNSGSSAERITPTQIIIGTDSDWSAVTTGFEHTIARKTDSTLWAWGNNSNGQLGEGTTTRRMTPRLIGSASDWSMVAGGYAHTIALKTDSTLWAWGFNQSGQLGDNTFTQRTTPRLIGNASDWSMVAAGYYHTLARKTDGTLWAWGNNVYGQLGLGDTGINRRTPTPIGIDSDWSKIAAGYYHTIALKTNSTLWAWGYNNKGQLGDGTTDDRNTPRQVGADSDWLAVSGANLSTIARKTDKTIWGWGTNFHGELGIGNNADRWTPSLINSESDWFVFATGGNHTLAIKTNGGIWSWGKNKYGQLGLGDKDVNTDRITPTQIGTDTDWLAVSGANLSTIAIKNNLTLWAWGSIGSYLLGLGDGYDRYNPVIIGTDSDWTRVAAGVYHIIGIKSNNTLWAWGWNPYGQLGDGTYDTRTTPRQIGIESDWNILSAGVYHSLARKTNGTIWSWGYNAYGQLGLGVTVDRNVPTLVGE